MFEILTDENVNLYQMKAYENPQCFSIDEFMDDMKRIKYIKRLFYRYHTKKILKERFNCKVGFSDHSKNSNIARAAIAAGNAPRRAG